MWKTLIVIFALMVLGIEKHFFWGLRFDVVDYYYPLVNNFFVTGSALAPEGYSMYQPGAVVFFLLAGLVNFGFLSVDNYLWSIMSLNALIVLGMSYFLTKFRGNKAQNVFLLLILIAGHMVFYRFELWVTVFVWGAIYFFKQQKLRWSFVSLAMATLVKIYPILWLPYFLWLVLKKQGRLVALKMLGWYWGFVLIFLLVFTSFFGVSAKTVLQDVKSHSLKPLYVDSVWFSVESLLSGGRVKSILEQGLFGISEEETMFNLSFYNYFWIVPVGGVYLWKFFNNKKCDLEVEFMGLVVVIFLVFSKILTPQYLLWFSLLLPLMSLKGKYEYVVVGLTLLLLLLTSIYFPVFFMDYANGYLQGEDKGKWVWEVLVARNVILVGLVWLVVKWVDRLRV